MYNYDNDYVRQHQKALNKKFNDNLPKWKVYYISAYWTSQRTIIIKGSVGYDQILQIEEVIQKPKLSIKDFINTMHKLYSSLKANHLKKDECFYGVIFNEHRLIQLILKSFSFYKKLQNIEELQDELEILESLHDTNKIKGIEKLSLSQKPNLTALLLLINLCQLRLFSNPSKNWIRVRTRNGRGSYGVTVERLPHDKDYNKFMFPTVSFGNPYRSF